jgi:PAS domain S-box-containing protein
MQEKINILFVEDLATDLEIIKRSIKKSDIQFIEKVVETSKDFIEALKSFSPDIILSDYTLPLFNGMQALNIRQELAPLTPFILVTGTNNEEIAVGSMKAGADDYILKDNLTRLGQAIRSAIDKYKYIRSKKEAEEALLESEDLFRTSFENAAIGVCMIDTKGKFVNINNTLCNMLGYTKEEMLQIPFNDTTFIEDENISTSYMDKIAMGEINMANYENRLIHKQGHIVWGNISMGKVNSPKSKSHYYVLYILNISEQKETEKKLLIAKEKAEESDQLKTAFLHNISHEIRTPMNAIIGFSGFLNTPNLSDQKREHFTDIIIQSSKQLLSIITDIISIATIEAGQEDIQESEININSTLKLLYEQFLGKAQEQYLTLSYTNPLSDENANIKTDPAKLNVILSNLIGNALKFTSKGGVFFGYQVKEKFLEFYIEDSGIGIAPEMHEEIFKRFRQVEYSSNRQYGGSGLGLSISKAYVELLGGKIWLHSELKKGAIFYFTIPYKKVREEVFTDNHIDDRLSDDRPRTILAVEDEDFNYLLLEEFLSDLDFNFKIIRAKDGLSSIDICRTNNNIDLILMDIKIPFLNGYEAAKQIKILLPEVPIIAQTAYSTNVDKDKAIACGCVDFISKPFEKEQLFAVIKKHIH